MKIMLMAFGALKGYGDIPIEQEQIGIDYVTKSDPPQRKKAIFRKQGVIGAIPYYEFVGIE